MKIQLHLNEKALLVLTDPSRIKAQLESQPVGRLLRVLEAVVIALYREDNAMWDGANTLDSVADALDEVIEVDDLEPRPVA